MPSSGEAGFSVPNHGHGSTRADGEPRSYGYWGVILSKQNPPAEEPQRNLCRSKASPGGLPGALVPTFVGLNRWNVDSIIPAVHYHTKNGRLLRDALISPEETRLIGQIFDITEGREKLIPGTLREELDTIEQN
jgi:hypothetical protein